MAEKHADLLAAHLQFGVAIDHLRDDEEVLFVRLHLRSLAGVERVLEGEGMEPVFFPERLENLRVAQPLDVEPADAAVVGESGQVGDGRDGFFHEAGAVVLDQSHGRLGGLVRRGEGGEGGRSGTGGGVALVEHGPKN